MNRVIFRVAGIGFKNLPMNQFGVREPELKKIARVPVLFVPQKSKR
jgi:hypothetical protein